MADPDLVRCDACPVTCYIKPGRAGACDRYANEDGRLVRVDPLVVLEHTIEADFSGYRCRCLDLEALIRVKRAAGRPKEAAHNAGTPACDLTAQEDGLRRFLLLAGLCLGLMGSISAKRSRKGRTKPDRTAPPMPFMVRRNGM